MKNFLSLFASELAKKQKEAIDKISISKTNKEKPKKSLLQTTIPAIETDISTNVEVQEMPKTILQLNTIPQIINTDQYKDAHSSDNPTGDYKAAYRLSLLADAIPFLEPNFNSSGNHVSGIYGNLIEAAASDFSYTQNILFDAQSNYKSSSLSGMGGVPEDWFPVNTVPSDWYNLLNDDDNLIELEIDLENGKLEDNQFITLNNNDTISWYTTENINTEQKTELHKDSSIKKIKLKILLVNFFRPWLDYEIFHLQNWKISGLPKGYFSTGNIDNNKGVFSLIPQSMLVGSQVDIEGNFHESDLRMINTEKEKLLSMGPFVLNSFNKSAKVETKNNTTVISSNAYQIVGYISRLVPYAPCIE